jgi:hypothetical protein
VSALEVVAARIPTPVDARGRRLRAYVGAVEGTWRNYWAIDGGKNREYVGPTFPFDRQGGRQARALNRLLNDEARTALPPDAPARCAHCGGPLPPTTTRQFRLTCSAACRQRLARQRRPNRGGVDSDATTADVTPFGASEGLTAPAPTGGLTKGSSRSARPAHPSAWDSRVRGPGEKRADRPVPGRTG